MRTSCYASYYFLGKESLTQALFVTFCEMLYQMSKLFINNKYSICF